MKGKFFTLAVITLLGFSTGSFAQARHFAATHPRRAEVNHRLKNQTERIHADVKDGKISKAEARKLHKRDRSILRKERRDAKKHNGHLTKREQRRLNKRENHVSKAIGK